VREVICQNLDVGRTMELTEHEIMVRTVTSKVVGDFETWNESSSRPMTVLVLLKDVDHVQLAPGEVRSCGLASASDAAARSGPQATRCAIF
jgi:hypothetical protein